MPPEFSFNHPRSCGAYPVDIWPVTMSLRILVPLTRARSTDADRFSEIYHNATGDPLSVCLGCGSEGALLGRSPGACALIA